MTKCRTVKGVFTDTRAGVIDDTGLRQCSERIPVHSLHWLGAAKRLNRLREVSCVFSLLHLHPELAGPDYA